MNNNRIDCRTLSQRVEQTLDRYGLLTGVRKLGVAVSGGADSLALLVLLAPVCKSRDVALVVLTLDHGRPGESEAAERVRAEAETLGLPFVTKRVALESVPGSSLEARARAARLAFLDECREKFSLDAIATGHHADDVAETVFLRLCRGSGTTGLAGIRPLSRCGKIRFIRPLFHILHGELCEWLAGQGKGWFEDPDNQSPDASRNRIRHRVLPELKATFDPALTRHLCTTAQLLAAEDDVLETLTETAFPSCVAGDALSIASLCSYPPAIRRRLLRRWFYGHDAAEAFDFERTEAILGLCGSCDTWRQSLPGGRRLEARDGRLAFVVDKPEPPTLLPVELPVSGGVVWGGWRITAARVDAVSCRAEGAGSSPAWCTVGFREGMRLYVRSRCAGDRLSPFGMQGSRKLQDLFVDAKIPADERPQIPVVVCDDEVVWIPGCRVSRFYAVPDGDGPMVRLSAERCEADGTLCVKDESVETEQGTDEMNQTAKGWMALALTGMCMANPVEAAKRGNPTPPEIQVKSTIDGALRPSYFYVPEGKAETKIPLLVALHTWSYDYKARNPLDWAYAQCRKRGWALLYPDFRGPNWTPQACGSDLAVQDILDAVEYAKTKAPIDPDRVYVIGASGGGMMSLLLAGRAPTVWAGVYSACPITDLARWHADSTVRRNRYRQHMERACGGTPATRAEEYAHRSPLTHLAAACAAKVHVQIATGIHDGHTGSVPIGHAIRGFNVLADAADRISEDLIAGMEQTQRVPEELVFKGRDPFFNEKNRIHLRRTSANVRLTIFEGGHGGNFEAGIDWLARQKRGANVDWTLPETGKGGEMKASK
ncbi:MAG: tRNA lysidine(34) synthetase TilS [Kiritimatiellae bacterium]|nr:tRNA lysidine(34) synthetase TilS [Kiritimatiellia bacterium]